MIVIEQATKHFGKTPVINNLSLQVNQGETLVLLGTSGSGKTTLLRLVNRLLELTSGSILLNGQNIAEQRPATLRRGIGYVLQNHGLFPHYTIAENIATVAKLLKWDEKSIKTRTEELIHKLSLPGGIENQYPHQLSGGQQQRVGLARALMTNPPVLLMDEPLGALDPITRLSIHKEFKQLDELKHKTTIMVTHDVQEAFDLGDRICILNNGKIEQTGTPYELLYKPENDFVRSFLNEQRLQLEFKTVKITDIWIFLSTQHIPVKRLANAHTDVWSLMNDLSRDDLISIQHLNDTKTFNLTEMMNAYHLFVRSKNG